jgi:hypothetical protein
MRVPTGVVNVSTLVLLAASLCAPARIGAHAAGGALLRYHWVVGQHWSDSEVDTSKTILQAKPVALGLNGTTVEVDRYTSTATVTKVFADGSGLVRVTYSKVSITKDGKITHYPLSGYALQLRVTTMGKVVSKKVLGSAAHLSDLPSSITDPKPTPYPQAPAQVGTTWTETQTQAGLGAVVYHLQVVALGSMGGRPTLTLHEYVNAPVRYSASGLVFAGVIAASGTGTSFIDTGATATTTTVPLALHAKLNGTIQGIKVSGTITVTGTQVITPAS